MRHTHRLDEDQAAELAESTDRITEAFDRAAAAADRVGEHAADVGRRVDGLRETIQIGVLAILACALLDLLLKLARRR